MVAQYDAIIVKMLQILEQNVLYTTAQALKLAKQHLSLIQTLGIKSSPVDELLCKHILALFGNEETKEACEKMKEGTSKIEAAAIAVKDIFSSLEEHNEEHSKHPLGSEPHYSFVNGLVASKYYLVSLSVRVCSAEPEDKIAKGLSDSGVLRDNFKFIAEIRGDEVLKAKAIATLVRDPECGLARVKTFMDKKNIEEAEKLWRVFEKKAGTGGDETQSGQASTTA